MSATYPIKLLLAFRSGDRCALPDCGILLTPDGGSGGPINIGKAAHIAGERAGTARYDSNMTDQERDHYRNLIYLCGVCHDKIDDKDQGEVDYPVHRLQQIKTEHETKVHKAIANGFADVGFLELEEATQWVLSVQTSQLGGDFTLIPPEDKLQKNSLGQSSRTVITMGLSVAREVQAYVESVAQIDSEFPDRLKSGFLTEYYRLKHKGHTGDDLFDLMCRFSQQGFEQQAKKCAGLALLVYLFEACEVFEK